MTVRRAPQRPPRFACAGVPRRSAAAAKPVCARAKTKSSPRACKDTGAAGPVVRSMSWDGTALKHTVWPVHPSGWKRPADYPIKGE